MLLALIILVPYAILLALFVVLWRRNQGVSEYRHGLLDRIHELASREASSGREWKWRYDAYNEITYMKQWREFWRPLDSFYDDRSFLSD